MEIESKMRDAEAEANDLIETIVRLRDLLDGAREEDARAFRVLTFAKGAAQTARDLIAILRKRR